MNTRWVSAAIYNLYNLAVASVSWDRVDIDPSSLAVSQSCELYTSLALILNFLPSGGPLASNRRTMMNTSSTTCSSQTSSRSRRMTAPPLRWSRVMTSLRGSSTPPPPPPGDGNPTAPGTTPGGPRGYAGGEGAYPK